MWNKFLNKSVLGRLLPSLRATTGRTLNFFMKEQNLSIKPTGYVITIIPREKLPKSPATSNLITHSHKPHEGKGQKLTPEEMKRLDEVLEEAENYRKYYPW